MRFHADENHLFVESIAAGKSDAVVVGDFHFKRQGIDVLVRGQSGDVYKFLAALNIQAPLAITKFQMGGLDSAEKATSAQLGLIFYLSPELASEEQPILEEQRARCSGSASADPEDGNTP